MVHVHYLESLAPFSDDIHSPVRIFFSDRDDFCRAADLGYFFLFDPYYTERFLLSQAFRNHFPVAGLEDVQRERPAGKQDHIKREKSQENADWNPAVKGGLF